MAEALELYVLELRSRRLSPETIKWYGQKLSAAITEWGNPEVDDVTPKLVREWLSGMETQPETTQGYYRALRAFFRWLVSEEELEKNPIDKVKAPSVPKKVKDRFSKEDEKPLLDACGKGLEGVRNRAIVSLMLDTGVRANDVCSLELDSIDLRERFIIVRRGKGGKGRQLPISDRAAKALGWWLARRPKVTGSHVFVSLRGGGPLTYWGLRSTLDRIGKRAGLHANPHKFRHSFATKYAGKGNLFSLQKILGHTSLEMVRRYAELSFEQVDEDYRRTMK